jgi:ADP-heptose:LPS heptosyltransferase
MNLQVMRSLDYWVGVPLCFIMTVVLRLAKLAGFFRPAEPKRVLFIELSEMGSAIIADPAMRLVSDNGRRIIHFAIFRKNAPSLRLLDTVPESRVFTFSSDGLPALVGDTLRFMLWCRHHRIDTVIDMEMFSRISALLSGLSGAVNRTGFVAYQQEGLYRGNMLTSAVNYNPHRHMVFNFLALAHAAIENQADNSPPCRTVIPPEQSQLARAARDPLALAAIQTILKSLYPAWHTGMRLVLMNPNASELLPHRRWPHMNYRSVIRTLLADYPDILVMITGAPSEFDEAEMLKIEAGHSRCVNGAGRFRFEQLVPLYQSADMMLSNDSGPGHFSSVTDLRTFIIFGPETPALYGSLGNSTPIYLGLACSPCVSAQNHRKTLCQDNRCVKDITPAMVLGFIRPYLEQKSHELSGIPHAMHLIETVCA